MVQDIECFRAELNSELLGDPRHFPILREGGVQIPQIWTDDRVSPGVAVRAEWRGHKTVRIEPCSMQLAVSCVKIASGNGIGPGVTGSKTVMYTVCNRAGGE